MASSPVNDTVLRENETCTELWLLLCVAFAPLFPDGNLPFSGTENDLDERQITHLICARLKYDLYDFFRGFLGAFYTRKRKEAGPKHPLKKSYRSYFRRAQIR